MRRVCFPVDLARCNRPLGAHRHLRGKSNRSIDKRLYPRLENSRKRRTLARMPRLRHQVVTLAVVIHDFSRRQGWLKPRGECEAPRASPPLPRRCCIRANTGRWPGLSTGQEETGIFPQPFRLTLVGEAGRRWETGRNPKREPPALIEPANGIGGAGFSSTLGGSVQPVMFCCHKNSKGSF
jgi:hypothetical protein